MSSSTAHRTSKRQRIEAFFLDRVGQRISSYALHGMFGSAVRTRISEINRDARRRIIIRNQVTFQDGEEHSVYWAEKRLVPRALPSTTPQLLCFPEFGDMAPESYGVD